MDYWKPNATVAAVIAREDGRLLMIEEHTPEGLRLNQPAGHLDPAESLQQAVEREALEETGWQVKAVALQGLYMGRYANRKAGIDVTYLRHAFLCEPVSHDPSRALDEGIVGAVWMTPAEILSQPERHRSPLVARTVEDFVAGKRYSLDLLWTHPSALEPSLLPPAPQPE